MKITNKRKKLYARIFFYRLSLRHELRTSGVMPAVDAERNAKNK
jgi:hypothetical protein